MLDPIIVTREIAIDPDSKTQDILVALDRLKSLSGVNLASHRSQNSHFEVAYDLLNTSYSDIEHILSENDVYRASSIRNRILSIWYEYLDITARDNANAPPPACCNKPPRRPL